MIVTAPDDQSFLRAWLPTQPAVAAWILAQGVRRQEAEDLVQEVALAAHRSYARYDAARPFVAWALGIARHKLADYYRQRPTGLWPLLDDEARTQLDQAAAGLVDECDDRLWAMQECVRRLDDRARSLIDRFYARDESVGGIAAALRLTQSAVKVRLHRIRQTLRRCVEQSMTAGQRR